VALTIGFHRQGVSTRTDANEEIIPSVVDDGFGAGHVFVLSSLQFKKTACQRNGTPARDGTLKKGRKSIQKKD
jgi:hypothetical protein